MFSVAVLTLLITGSAYTADDAGKAPTHVKKLKIIFLMGQSNMVGYFNPTTAWYLTQPMYVPPPKVATVKDRYYDGGQFYWSGVQFGTGPDGFKEKGEALLEARKASRGLWRDRIFGNFSREAKAAGKKDEWNYKEWGQPPSGGGMENREFLDQKAEEEGIYKRMVEHIESPENKLHPKVALEQLATRDEPIADDIKRVRELFLNGTKPEDFDRLNQAIKANKNFASDRAAYAKMLKETINLPIAERTHISAFGAVSGAEVPGTEFTKVAQGPLTVGYALWPQNSGPEYPFGISFERMVDGPVLLVKCSWGGTSLDTDWRPPSLATPEKPTGQRLTWTMAHIRKVLADPGMYHPDYDPKEGYELAGLVWFQGWNDIGNKKYGEQLVSFIKDFRKEVKAPKLPVVCGLLGHVGWKLNTFDGDVNSGMLFAANHPDLKGTVDIVNTVKYMPLELNFKKTVEAAYGKESAEYKKAEQIINRACSKDATHYFGAAKFGYLTGDAMARKLANLVKGGEPTIFKEAAEILGTEGK
jgi:hypothetical protein